MKVASYHRKHLKQLLVLIPLLLLVCRAEEARAQWVYKWLNVGSLHHLYGEAGGAVEPTGGLQWPADLPNQDMRRSRGMWVTATDWTGANGENYPVKIAHIGPRDTGVGEMFPQRFILKSRFPKPRVYVDDLETFQKAVTVDTVDATMKAARALDNVVNTVTGITVRREIKAWSQEYHDNYHISSVTLTNTGNIDDDPEQELDQTMTGVYLYETVRHAGPADAGFGNYDMNDVVTGESTDDINDYNIDFRAHFTWAGYLNNTELGQPLVEGHGLAPEGDTTGRLRSTQFVGKVALHADQSAENTSNDPEQPSTLGWRWDADGKQMDPENTTQMQEDFEQYVTQGVMTPHHADIIIPPSPEYGNWIERMADQTSDPGRGRNGISATWAFGPYTLEPGQSVNIVYAQAISGISTQAAFEIGERYEDAGVWDGGTGGNKGPDIQYDVNNNGVIEADEIRTKNEWFLTGRDSLFDTFKRARANYQADQHIPYAPRPPREFRVSSGTGQINLSWQTFDGESPAGGFEIYRTRNAWYGAVENRYEYELIADLGPEARSYEDSDVQRGVGYYYYIQSVGEVNNDPTAMTPTGVRLKSSRYYTQTYDPAQLKRPPGSSLEAARVVPNPYHLGSDQNVRWPDRQDKMGFLDVPGNATIRIYTEAGELIETIRHTDGSGDAYWDMTTSSNQLVVSGVYVAVIQDEDTGEQVIRNFIVIR